MMLLMTTRAIVNGYDEKEENDDGDAEDEVEDKDEDEGKAVATATAMAATAATARAVAETATATATLEAKMNNNQSKAKIPPLDEEADKHADAYCVCRRRRGRIFLRLTRGWRTKMKTKAMIRPKTNMQANPKCAHTQPLHDDIKHGNGNSMMMTASCGRGYAWL